MDKYRRFILTVIVVLVCLLEMSNCGKLRHHGHDKKPHLKRKLHDLHLRHMKNKHFQMETYEDSADRVRKNSPIVTESETSPPPRPKSANRRLQRMKILEGHRAVLQYEVPKKVLEATPPGNKNGRNKISRFDDQETKVKVNPTKLPRKIEDTSKDESRKSNVVARDGEKLESYDELKKRFTYDDESTLPILDIPILDDTTAETDLEEEDEFQPISMPTEFRDYDKNGDGFITLKELIAETGASENVGDAFAASDKNGDAKLDETEFHNAPWRLADQETADAVLENDDADDETENESEDDDDDDLVLVPADDDDSDEEEEGGEGEKLTSTSTTDSSTNSEDETDDDEVDMLNARNDWLDGNDEDDDDEFDDLDLEGSLQDWSSNLNGVD
ncbi:uncharacterized protein LOC141902040 [Tubulanus polymorphus]|uniref:uncharacterized protein LOC141902040 n=1 Tax=Tubulanus polymorphus TaxID=672921 RepID=UPI003DA40054